MVYSVLVRPPQASDELVWRRLWAAYLDFHGATVAPEATEQTLKRILDPFSSMFGRIAELNGTPVGFAICVVHEGTGACGQPATWRTSSSILSHAP